MKNKTQFVLDELRNPPHRKRNDVDLFLFDFNFFHFRYKPQQGVAWNVVEIGTMNVVKLVILPEPKDIDWSLYPPAKIKDRRNSKDGQAQSQLPSVPENGVPPTNGAGANGT